MSSQVSLFSLPSILFAVAQAGCLGLWSGHTIPSGMMMVFLRYTYIYIPVGPHKEVAAVSIIGNYRRGELVWCMDGRANPPMDRKVVEALILFFLHLYLHLFFPLSVYLSTCLSICLSVCLAICLSVYLSISISLSLYLSISLSLYLSISLPLYLAI